jgi:hypothetical protein
MLNEPFILSSRIDWSIVSTDRKIYVFTKHTRLSCIKDLQQEEFEDTKGVIRIRISKKNIQHNGQKKKYKRTNNDLKKHTHGTKDRITRTPLKTGDERRCSGRVGSSCSISGTRRRVKLVTNPAISHEWWKDRGVFTTSGTYQWSFVTQIFHNGQPWQGGGRKTFAVMTST